MLANLLSSFQVVTFNSTSGVRCSWIACNISVSCMSIILRTSKMIHDISWVDWFALSFYRLVLRFSVRVRCVASVMLVGLNCFQYQLAIVVIHNTCRVAEYTVWKRSNFWLEQKRKKWSSYLSKPIYFKTEKVSLDSNFPYFLYRHAKTVWFTIASPDIGFFRSKRYTDQRVIFWEKNIYMRIDIMNYI